MAFNNLPPQAYTRDVLAAAYEWLRSQPASIRELATSSDNLVSLFMQARRRPNSLGQLVPNKSETQPPLSGAGAEAFKNDLKNLAEGLKQFEDQKSFIENGLTPSTLPQPYTQAAQQPASGAPSPPLTAPAAASSPAPVASAPLNLDARSLEVVRKVQHLFNLSSEREALRLLLAVGYEKVKTFIS